MLTLVNDDLINVIPSFAMAFSFTGLWRFGGREGVEPIPAVNMKGGAQPGHFICPSQGHIYRQTTLLG